MLPYSREVLYSLFGELNASFAALQSIGAALFLAALGSLALSKARLALGLPGLLWIACGICWYFNIFAPINFLAPVYGWIALIQGIALLAACTRSPQLRSGTALLSTYAALVLLLSLIDLFAGPGWPLTRLPGLHPEPLILLTTATALSLSRRRFGGALILLPLLLAGVAGYEAYALDMPQNYLVPAACLPGAIILFIPRRG